MRPLEGVKVVDFGHFIAGPLAGMLFADQGASVTKIDPPGGPRWKDIGADILDRGKTRMTLDLKRREGLERARHIVAEADILIENFRPGVMARLGLGPDDCLAVNPRLNYLSLPGFASGDAELRDIAAWEGVIAALMGQFRDMGLNRVLMGIDPSYSPLTLASAYGGVLGATAAMTALAAGAQGRVIEVPLASALLEGLVFNAMRLERMPERYLGHREREIARRRDMGEPFDLSYSQVQTLLDPFYRSYVCSDGRPYYLVACSHSRHPEQALRALGLWDEFVAKGLPVGDAYAPSHTWPEGRDCVLSSYPLSRRWADALCERMQAVFMTRTAEEWEETLGEAGVPGSAHRTTVEWLGSEHAVASGLLCDADHPRVGRLRQPGPTVWFDAPRPTEPGAEPVRAAGGRPFTAWLAGLRVLDLTNVIAGPTIGHMLARFGADVVKIDPVTPAFDPWTTVGFGIAVNRGKRSVLLNLARAEGQAALDRLIETADLVLVNAPAPQAARLGLTAERVAAANSRGLLCRIDAFGGPHTGPRSHHPGYDDSIQAATGIMSRFGGSIATPEEHAHVGTIDVLCGFAGTFACAVALYGRRKGRPPGTARTSLAAIGQIIQLPFMRDHAGCRHGHEASGRGAKGEGPLCRAYRTSDGWMFVAADPAIPGLEKRLVGLSAAAGEDDLERLFEIEPVAHWRKVLSRIGVEAVPMRRLADLRADALRQDCSGPSERLPTAVYERIEDHPAGPVELLSPCGIRVRGDTLPRLSPAPAYGQHTREILGEVGCSQALLDKRSIGSDWSTRYLPI